MLRRLRRQAPDDDAATLSAALVRRVVEGVVRQARAEGVEDAEDAATAALAAREAERGCCIGSACAPMPTQIGKGMQRGREVSP